jgi:hypothetical protein
MVLLAFLGFTDFSRALSLNDKLLHFLCFMIATGVFYFIVDIEEYVSLPFSLSLILYVDDVNLCDGVQECKKSMVLEILQPHIHALHVFLLWWDYK